MFFFQYCFCWELVHLVFPSTIYYTAYKLLIPLCKSSFKLCTGSFGISTWCRLFNIEFHLSHQILSKIYSLHTALKNSHNRCSTDMSSTICYSSNKAWCFIPTLQTHCLYWSLILSNQLRNYNQQMDWIVV